MFDYIKVNSALTLDHTKSQWVDLGIHTEVCMSLPETCGAAGGAISAWVKMGDCSGVCGIISSYGYNTGSVIYGVYDDIRYETLYFYFI